MQNAKIIFILISMCFSLITAGCSKQAVGYVEVRNHLDQEIKDVSWGSSISLETIGASEEQGGETILFGAEYIYLKHNNLLYRTDTAIVIDARSSATYIVDDLDKLVLEE